MKKEIRNLKIASVLHRAISRVLMEGKVFNKNVTVSDVKLSKDLKKADVYIVLSSLNIQVADYSDSEKVHGFQHPALEILLRIIVILTLLLMK